MALSQPNRFIATTETWRWRQAAAKRLAESDSKTRKFVAEVWRQDIKTAALTEGKIPQFLRYT